MSLIERSVFLMRDANEIRKEHEEFISFDTNEKRVHLSFYGGLEYNFKSFVDLADGRKIVFEVRGDLDYPYKAYFEVDEVEFFVLLKEGRKEELEDLINEAEKNLK